MPEVERVVPNALWHVRRIQTSALRTTRSTLAEGANDSRASPGASA